MKTEFVVYLRTCHNEFYSSKYFSLENKLVFREIFTNALLFSYRYRNILPNTESPRDPSLLP